MSTDLGLPVALDRERRDALGRRARRLAATSVVYNVTEASIAISAGSVAGSAALVGFGLDSVVEVSSGYASLDQAAVEAVRDWRFRNNSGATVQVAPVIRFELRPDEKR